MFHQNYKKTILTIITTLLVVYIVNKLFGSNFEFLFNKIISRFNIKENGQVTMSGITTGRSTLLEEYIYYIGQDLISLFFGRGINYFGFYKQLGLSYIAHNTYLDFLLSWGIIGSTIFILCFIFNIKNEISNKNKKYNQYIPLCLLLIMLLSLSCMAADMFWYLLALVVLPLKFSSKFKEGEIK